MTATPATPSEVDDLDAQYWLREIEAAKDRLESWYTAALKSIDRYKDCESRAFGKLNLVWANVEVQKAALGEDFGDPQVTRLNAPSNAYLSRHVSRVWEQTIDAAVKETGDNHEIRCAVHDVLLPGRGQVWLELNPVRETVIDPETGAPKEEIVWVEAPLVRLDHKDYLEGAANRWGAVPWVARGDLYTLDDLKKILPEDRQHEVELIPRNFSLPMPKTMKGGDSEQHKEQFKRARVWEIWAKSPEKRRIYVAEGYDKAIKVDADPYRLKKFFPCPRPIIANGDEAWQVPITDYSRYQDQSEEIDRLSERIFVLTDVLRRRGVYDKQFKQLADLALASENVFLAVDNWVELQQKGGLNKVVEWEDLTPIIMVLTELHKQRAELIQLTYQLNGISDLARGMTDPDETLGAQKLKMSYGSGRFQDRQKESRRFAAEAYALKGELIAEHFPREQIQEMSGIPLPTIAERQEAQRLLLALMKFAQEAQQRGLPSIIDPYQIHDLQEVAQATCTWEKVSSILRSDRRRCYMVEVATDQTQFKDEEADKQARIELLGVINQLMQQFGPMIAGNPANGEFFKKMIMFVVSSFKAGRAIEEGLEQAIDAAIQQAAQQGQQQQQQDPKAQADMMIAQARIQTAQVGLQTAQVRLAQAQVEAQRAGADIAAETHLSQVKAMEATQKAQAAQITAQAKASESAEKAHAAAVTSDAKSRDAQMKAVESQQKVQAQHDANTAKRHGQQIDNLAKAEKLQFERAARATAEEAILKGPTQTPQQSGAPA